MAPIPLPTPEPQPVWVPLSPAPHGHGLARRAKGSCGSNDTRVERPLFAAESSVWSRKAFMTLKGYSELQLYLFFAGAVLFSWGFSTQSEETLHLENYKFCSCQ